MLSLEISHLACTNHCTTVESVSWSISSEPESMWLQTMTRILSPGTWLPTYGVLFDYSNLNNFQMFDSALRSLLHPLTKSITNLVPFCRIMTYPVSWCEFPAFLWNIWPIRLLRSHHQIASQNKHLICTICCGMCGIGIMEEGRLVVLVYRDLLYDNTMG